MSVIVILSSFLMFSRDSFFQLNCYSVLDAAHPPSVDKANKNPLLPSHARELQERAVMVCFPLLFIPPLHHSKLFFTAFFQLNCYSVGHASRPPSVSKACHSSTPQQCHSKPVLVSLSVFFKSPHPNFSPWSNFQLNCSSVHCASRFPSVDMANKSPLLPSHTHKSCGEGDNSECSFPFYSPPFQTFSQLLFLIKLLSHPLCQPPSLSQPWEQGPTITIVPPVVW